MNARFRNALLVALAVALAAVLVIRGNRRANDRAATPASPPESARSEARAPSPIAAPGAIAAPEIDVMRRAAGQAGLTAASEGAGAAPVPAEQPEQAGRDPLPGSPQSLTVDAVAPSKIVITWSAPANASATRYELVRDGAALAVVRGNSFADESIRPSSRHCYAVAAVDGGGRRSARSRTACAETPDSAPPTAPPAVQAVATGERQVAVSWDAATDDSGDIAAYEVTRAGAVVGKVAGKAMTESGLVPAQTYCYTVRAFDAAGNASPPSAPACASTPDLTPPTAPSSIVAEADGEHAVRVRWEPSVDDVGVTAYELLREGHVVATTAELTATEKSLKPTVTYCYTVRARDAAGNRSLAAGPACATPPDLTPPSVPADVLVSAASDTKLEIRWSPSTDEVGVAGYELFRERSSVAVTDGATEAADVGLRPGRQYCYYVRAHDEAGNVSAASRRACGFTPDLTPPTPPAHFVAAANAPTKIVLAWGASADDVGVATYEIRRGDRVVARVDGHDTGYLDTGLLPETEACYTVVALDAAGNRSAVEGPACSKTAPAGVPSAPTELVAEAAPAAIQLTWTPSIDHDVVYTVYWERGGSDKSGRVGSTPKTTYTAVARSGERRCYRVSAIDVAGRESPRSFEACAIARSDTSRRTASR
jgi:chitodextrinase